MPLHDKLKQEVYITTTFRAISNLVTFKCVIRDDSKRLKNNNIARKVEAL